MYSTVFWCLLVILLFIWLYCITTVTIACSTLSDSAEDAKENGTRKVGGALPNPCTAFSQSLSVNSFR